MRNHITVLLRTMQREKLYAIINIAGLSLGIASCLILGLFLNNELTYDQHFKGHENIYRVVNAFAMNGGNDTFAVTSSAFGPMIAEEYPSVVKAYVRFQGGTGKGGLAMRHGEKVFYWEHNYFVDPNVFEVFSHDVIYGDPATALKEGRSIAISASFAKKYFGDENPIGQTLTTDAGVANKVTLVFGDLPVNTHLKYDLLFSNNVPSVRLTDNPTMRRQQLTGVGIYTYVSLQSGMKAADWDRISSEFSDKPRWPPQTPPPVATSNSPS